MASPSTNYTAGALGPRTPTAGSGNERSRAKGRSSNMPNLGVRRTEGWVEGMNRIVLNAPSTQTPHNAYYHTTILDYCSMGVLVCTSPGVRASRPHGAPRQSTPPRGVPYRCFLWRARPSTLPLVGLGLFALRLRFALLPQLTKTLLG